MSVQMKLEGLDDVFADIDEICNEAELEDALGKACALVEGEAKKNAPKNTGELRNSIASKIEGEVGIVYTPLFYAPYVEYGTGIFSEKGGRQDVPWYYKDEKGEWHSTSGMKPQPYLIPALYDNRQEIANLFKEVIRLD